MSDSEIKPEKTRLLGTPSPGMYVYSRAELFKWSLMAFIAGSINAGGFLACQRFVSHVTGFATLFGVGMAERSAFKGLSMLSVPVFFLLGAMLAGYLTDVRLQRGHKPRYGLVMGIVALLLALAALFGHFELFGAFGADYGGADFTLLVMLCGSCGLQNAAVTISSKSLMRSTHLTGMTTDLGIDIVRSLFGRHNRRRRLFEFYRTFVRLCIIFFFCLGSLVGAVLFLKFNYFGFLMPSGLALATALFGKTIFLPKTT